MNSIYQYLLIFLIILIPIMRCPIIGGPTIGVIKYCLATFILFIFFFKIDFKSKRNFIYSPFSIIFLMFTLLLFVNYFISIDPGLTLSYCLAHIISFCFFYLFMDIVKDKNFLKKILIIFIVMGVLIGCLSIIQYSVGKFMLFPRLTNFVLSPVQKQEFLNGSSIFKEMSFRSVGSFFHPNFLGLYLAYIYPIVLIFMLFVKNRLFKTVLFICLCIIFTGIMCSGSRGGFLNISCSTMFVLFFLRKKINKILFLSFICFIGTILLNKPESFIRLADGVSFRNIIWENSFKMIKDNPILGSGLGTYHLESVPRFGFPSIVDFEIMINNIKQSSSMEELMACNSHNVFLNYAAETGMFGMLLIISIYILYMIIFFKTIYHSKNINLFDYNVIVGCSAVVLSNFVHGFFETPVNFYNFSISILFVFILGTGVGLMNLNKDRSNVV